MNIYLILIIYILIINIIGFFIMAYDKNLATKHKMRVSEKTLFTIAFFFGAIGIYSGMYKFRHKTKHNSFKIGIPILIILNITLLYFLLMYILPNFKIV